MTEISEEDSWLLIETAPRDGTKIVLFGKHVQCPSSADGLLVTIGQYFAALDCWITEGGVIYDATHWMPLPHPPEKQRPKQKNDVKDKAAPLKKISRAPGVERLRAYFEKKGLR